MTRPRLAVTQVSVGGPGFACCRRPHTRHVVDYLECDCFRTELPIEAQSNSSGRLASDHESVARDGRLARACDSVESAMPGFGAAWDRELRREVSKARRSGKLGVR